MISTQFIFVIVLLLGFQGAGFAEQAAAVQPVTQEGSGETEPATAVLKGPGPSERPDNGARPHQKFQTPI